MFNKEAKRVFIKQLSEGYFDVYGPYLQNVTEEITHLTLFIMLQNKSKYFDMITYNKSLKLNLT